MSGTEIEIPETLHIEAEQPEAEAAPSGERQKTPRELQMEAIAARAEERRQAEIAQAAVYDEDARTAGLTFPAEEPQEAPAPVAQPVAPPTAPIAQTAPAPAAAPAVRTVNLDGQDYRVTDEQYDQLARLGMVANVALHQYQHPAAPQPVAPAPQPPAPIADPDLIRETVRQIQFGGEEAGAEALTRLVTTVAARMPAAPQIDPNAIISQAVAQARAVQQLETDRHVIQQEYADIFANPQRTFLARANVEAIRARNVATGARQTDLDIYREAGNMVREAMGLSRPGNQETSPALQAASMPVQPRQDVIERKRAAPRATQAIDLRAPTPQAPRPPTGSEIVDQMRRSRGQASMR